MILTKGLSVGKKMMNTIGITNNNSILAITFVDASERKRSDILLKVIKTK